MGVVCSFGEGWFKKGVKTNEIRKQREVRNLECGVNYERQGHSVGRKEMRSLHGY